MLFGRQFYAAHDAPCDPPLGEAFSLTTLAFVRKHSRQTYWDLHVFGTNNYMSNGIVSHNSGKTRSFAKMAAVYALRLASANKKGVILCAREYMNSLADSSFMEIATAIREEPWMMPHFDLGETYIRTRNRNIEFLFRGLNKNINSIKSVGRIHLCWVDEAEAVTEKAWIKLLPTIRGSDNTDDPEVWITWNPERKNSATHIRFRQKPAADAKFVELNWRDNPWFPRKLEKDRQDDLTQRPEQYNHIWEGDFATSAAGAYFASHLLAAKADGRISALSVDPLMGLRAFWDIGGTGARADATSIWIVQWIGKSIYVLDHYTAEHQPLSTHVNWLKKKGYENALCVLPHDGATYEKTHAVSYESMLEEAGFEVQIIKNQGRGAAKMRVEAARRHFSKVWFDEKRTENGRISLGWYHEKISSDSRYAMMGPDHDWSSHDADAFGLIFVAYEQPKTPLQMQAFQDLQPDDSWVM
jgi:phage terminase large subunit